MLGYMQIYANEQVIIKDESHSLMILQFLHEQLEENTSQFMKELQERDEQNYNSIFRILKFTLNETSSKKRIDEVLKKTFCVFQKQYSALFARMTLHTKQLLRSPKTIRLYFSNDDILVDIHIKTNDGESILISDEYLTKAAISRSEFEQMGLLLSHTK
jgi:hypothetical protein